MRNNSSTQQLVDVLFRPPSSEEEESEEDGEDPALDSLSQAIAFQVNEQIQNSNTSILEMFTSRKQQGIVWRNRFKMKTVKLMPPTAFGSSVSLQRARIEEEEEEKHWKQVVVPQRDDAHPSTSADSRKPRIKKSAYFSDEEELSD